MKYLLLFIMMSIFCSHLYSCKKDSDSNISSRKNIVGKWRIINDTSFLEGNWNYDGRSSNYVGLLDDYYNFTFDGKLYIKKGSEFDTGSYSLPTESQLMTVFYSLGNIHFEPDGLERGPYQIAFKGNDTLTATLSSLTPQGKEFELLNLTR